MSTGSSPPRKRLLHNLPYPTKIQTQIAKRTLNITKSTKNKFNVIHCIFVFLVCIVIYAVYLSVTLFVFMDDDSASTLVDPDVFYKSSLVLPLVDSTTSNMGNDGLKVSVIEPHNEKPPIREQPKVRVMNNLYPKKNNNNKGNDKLNVLESHVEKPVREQLKVHAVVNNAIEKNIKNNRVGKVASRNHMNNMPKNVYVWRIPPEGDDSGDTINHLNGSDENKHRKKPLIVGATDGSGTRSMVGLLLKLGVRVIFDNPGTMDVEGQQMADKKGWPDVVIPVLKEVASLDYDIHNLSDEVVSSTIKNLTAMVDDHLLTFKVIDEAEKFGQTDKFLSLPKIKGIRSSGFNATRIDELIDSNYNLSSSKSKFKLNEKARQLLSQRLKDKINGGKNNIATFTSKHAIFLPKLAKDITYAIKAPISMSLIPFFNHIYKPVSTKNKNDEGSSHNNGFKFLHIVRDGRDISYSGNQSPVRKFYPSMYFKSNATANHKDAMSISFEGLVDEDIDHLKAMRLWNDWNHQVYKYSERQINKQDDHNNDEENGFEYMLVRIEDFTLAESLQQKYNFIKRLSSFVGSRVSDEEMCEIAKEKGKDMGSHSFQRTKQITAGAKLGKNKVHASKAGNKNNSKKKDFHTKIVGKGALPKLTDRYGKWVEPLSKNEALSTRMHEIGKAGLVAFGYEPFITFDDFASVDLHEVVTFECI